LANLEEVVMQVNQDQLDQQALRAELVIQVQLDKMVCQVHPGLQVPLGQQASVVKLDQLDNQE
jgi:hypothetical protein